MKRVNIFRNGCSTDGILLSVPSTMCQLLAEAGRKLEMTAKKLYSPRGATVDDTNVLRDDDILYLSSGEPFKPICGIIAPNECFTGPETVRSMPREVRPVTGGDWINLNVGGTNFSTTRSTLTTKEPDSMLARMFDSEQNYVWQSSVDPSGAYLIDRSPVFFEPILNYLRHGELVMNKGVNPRGVMEEAKFFGIMSLVELLGARIRDEEPACDRTPITRREFVFKLMSTPPEWELRCQGMNFAGADMSKLDLRHINFKYAILRGANLTGANLSFCNFERADVSRATLNGANLLAVKMLCVNLENAVMHGCNFEDPAGVRANMEGANMKFVDLEGSHMAGVNLRVATLKNANLQNCDLRGAVLAGADLENCDLSGCDLQEANLRGANLKGAAFELMLNPLHMSQTVR